MERRDHAGTGPGGASAGERIEQAGREGAAVFKDEARSSLERGKSSAAGMAGDASDALEEAASSLASQGRDSLADAASMMSTRLSGLAEALESRSVDDLLRQARRMARENPALFAAGGVAVGLALARFFRASTGAEHESSAPTDRRPPARAAQAPSNATGPGAVGPTPGQGSMTAPSSTAGDVGGRYD